MCQGVKLVDSSILTSHSLQTLQTDAGYCVSQIVINEYSYNKEINMTDLKTRIFSKKTNNIITIYFTVDLTSW